MCSKSRVADLKAYAFKRLVDPGRNMKSEVAQGHKGCMVCEEFENNSETDVGPLG